ncbi:MAG: DUF5700 domain-containing putative Zn-dependent protease [Blastocatellia bacterium]
MQTLWQDLRARMSLRKTGLTLLVALTLASGIYAIRAKKPSSILPIAFAQTTMAPAMDVRLVNDEAEAVLAILAKRDARQHITEADWQRVFASEGYIRLKQRETAMNNSFEDESFRAFVLSDNLAAQRQAMADTLAKWMKADMTRAGHLAQAYLPKTARIRAKIYPVIKPRDNSFVFDVKGDPAIFLYLDPTVSREKFENTLAHELHHIGYSSSCPSAAAVREIAALPPNTQGVVKLAGMFGEGFAMLAAAGGPAIHPHAVSKAEERARWDRDVANFNTDLKTIEEFFVAILENRLSRGEIQKTAFSFLGVQGPWYTVGWRMSVVIEQAYGRAKLIECICDQRKLLATYNQAVAKGRRQSRPPLAVWSASLLNEIKRGKN